MQVVVPLSKVKVSSGTTFMKKTWCLLKRVEMNYNFVVVYIAAIVIYCTNLSQGLQRCFTCRSRGELGSCKDPFIVNVTIVEAKQEIGVQTVPCASGWCGKIVETEDTAKEEYGVATQRMCLQRGPSDSEDRCAYTKWNYRRVLMCFCKGDLCNSSKKLDANFLVIIISTLLSYSLILWVGSWT